MKESLGIPCSTTPLCGIGEESGTASSTCTASSLCEMVNGGQCGKPGMVGHSRVMGGVLGGDEQGGNEDGPASCGCYNC